ncbi:hypothetical protein B0A54_16303 [Friedmanniomyces endolithicus]|uniref:Uncharacterized protein n=1 Tax=Friedmanniomyces endolithicus TaxID=329885 RepID=A0A4V5N5H0_9PEZI|nr:hypothetical protein B0A54_16303 [Friedmanniomyces endolithicus]
MCYHKYTHFNACSLHVPIHTHMCQKNLTEDATRVIFCEDYRTVRLRLQQKCPHCPPSLASPGSTWSMGGSGSGSGSGSGRGGVGGTGYPTPPDERDGGEEGRRGR